MRGKWFAIFVMLVCGGLLAWRHCPRFAQPDPDDANGPVWQTLHQRVDLSGESFSREDVKASDALDELSRHLKIPIAIDPAAALDLQPVLNAKMSLPQEPLTAIELIHWILIESGGRGASPMVKNGQVIITSSQERDSPRFFDGQVHVIPADLLATTGEDSQYFAEVIQEVVDPDHWVGVGGNAEIRALPGALAVVDSFETQLQIAQLIEAIAQAHRHPERLDPLLVAPPNATSTDPIQTKLDQLVQFTVKDVKLREVADQLQAMYELPIAIDRESLEENGTDLDVPMTIDVKDVSLRFLLQQMLATHQLTFETRHRFVTITTSDAVETPPFHQVVYPVSDWTASTEPYDVISQMITPDEWSDVGGDASVVSCGQAVVVSHRSDVFAQITDLLQRWRAVRQSEDLDIDRVDRQRHSGEWDLLDRLVSTHAHDVPLEPWLRELLASCGFRLIVDEAALFEVGSTEPFLDQDIQLDSVPLRQVLETALTPLKLELVHGDRHTMILTTPEAAITHWPVRVYNVETLIGPRADDERQEELIDLLLTTIAPGTWSYFGREAEATIVDNVLMVRQSEAAHRVLRSLLEHLIQVPDQPDAFGVLADPLELKLVIDSESADPELFVTRVYFFPKTKPSESGELESTTSLARQIREEIVDQVQPYSWDEIGGDASAEIYSVDGREALVIANSEAGHHEVQHFLDARQVVEGRSTTGDTSVAWQHLELPGDERTPPCKLCLRSVYAELDLLDRMMTWVPSSETLRELLDFKGYDRSEFNGEPPTPYRHYLYKGQLQVIVDAEESSDDACRSVDLLLQSLREVEQATAVPNDVGLEHRCERLVAVMLDDADETRRRVAAFVLRQKMNFSELRLSDVVLQRIQQQLAVVEDPSTCRALLMLMAAAKERAAPLIPQLLEALPRIAPRLQEEAIVRLGEVGPSAVPFLCQLTREKDPNRLTLVLQQLKRAAGTSNESAIRTIIESHVHADVVVQKTIADMLPELDPKETITRAVVDELSKRSDPLFQERWIPLRDAILLKLGDPE